MPCGHRCHLKRHFSPELTWPLQPPEAACFCFFLHLFLVPLGECHCRQRLTFHTLGILTCCCSVVSRTCFVMPQKERTMIINNRQLLENRKWNLCDPRLPLTPAVLPAARTTWLVSRRLHSCQNVTPWGCQLAEAGQVGSRQWAGRGQTLALSHVTGAEEIEAE